YTCTAAGAVGLAMLTVPAVTGRNVMRFFGRWPLVGGTAVRLLQAARIYRERLGAVMLTIVMSIAVHSLLTLGFYLLSIGLPGGSPTLAEHFVIVPLSMLAGVVPLPFNAAGAFDFVVDVLYRRLSSVTG